MLRMYLFLTCLATVLQMSAQIAEIVHYFPDVSGDLSRVTWGHAINSAKELNDNLNDKNIHMLEADVLMGDVVGKITTNKIPIMAHPPNISSDISLETWIDEVVMTVKQNKLQKGIKLDFKELAAVMPSLRILQNYKKQIDFPLLLNADILPGPGNPTSAPVDADTFLSICSEFFPEATLSIGWTTKFNSFSDPAGIYTMQMVQEMSKKISMNSIGQPVTFPIRAAFVARSIEALEYLVDNVEDSTISIWSSPTDTVDSEALVNLRDLLGHDIVYYDLPEEQMNHFVNAKNAAEERVRQNAESSGKGLTGGASEVLFSPYAILSFVSLTLAYVCLLFLSSFITS